MSETVTVAENTQPVPTQEAAPTEQPAPGPLQLGETKPAAVAPDPAPVAYAPTGDPAIDLGLDFIGNLGLGRDNPAVQAAEGGDFGPIEKLLGDMGERAKGYEKVLRVFEAAYNRTRADVTAKAEQQKQALYEAAGGEDSWKALKDWAVKEAEPAELESINAVLRSGGLAATLVVKALAGIREGATQAQAALPAAILTPGAAAKQAGSGQLAMPEYLKQVRALHAEMGPAMNHSPQYKALQARLVT